MARPRTNLTTAAGAPSTSTIERTYSDTVSVSAASVATWDIPDNCIRVEIVTANFDLAGTVLNPKMRLKKASDGVAALFSRTVVYGTTPISSSDPSTADALIIGLNGATVLGWSTTLHFPRDASIKTTGVGEFHVDEDDLFRRSKFGAVTAEDHDQIELTGATSITGDIHIIYTVTESLA